MPAEAWGFTDRLRECKCNRGFIPTADTARSPNPDFPDVHSLTMHLSYRLLSDAKFRKRAYRKAPIENSPMAALYRDPRYLSLWISLCLRARSREGCIFISRSSLMAKSRCSIASAFSSGQCSRSNSASWSLVRAISGRNLSRVSPLSLSPWRRRSLVCRHFCLTSRTAEYTFVFLHRHLVSYMLNFEKLDKAGD